MKCVEKNLRIFVRKLKDSLKKRQGLEVEINVNEQVRTIMSFVEEEFEKKF